ncbi:MAG: bifunctional 3,4-dihydroxy-2-butanone-4-phosphate synthase/GTP cyclohydrolase II [Methylococcales bacterium]|nr:bifunctional 3,4-dihydroxy-2-butanone-4-phosphate synthase/GTP cyclohydrolase II [Methylococcales bacterium]
MNSIEDIIADIAAGRMVVIMDDEDRENEGDLIMAARYTRPQDINFMARYGRGLICLTLTEQRCRQLRLPLMVRNNLAAHSTNFTLSIEAANGVTTGISAADRAHTIQTAVAKDAVPEDLVQPGHVFPLMAKPGGVLNRAGHTEAGCDLARLAGLEPAGVIVEILNDDGSMARKPDLVKFAQQHNLKIGTIADLIQYRIKHENSLDRIGDCPLPTEFGEFRLYAYQDCNDNRIHLALVMGQVAGEEPVLVRVHARPMLDDLMAVNRPGSSVSLRQAMATIARQGKGVIVLIRQTDCDQAILDYLHDLTLSTSAWEQSDWRTTGTGSRILADLGVHKLNVLGSQKRFFGLSGFDLEVVDYVSTPEG